ncbi:MAG: histidine--tRNA ligase [Deltaproteobacteria bacterium]|nr:histidine--tRNA ligase [Deltaproteobacteria bacterium]
MALQTLKGMQDILPADIKRWQAVEAQLAALATAYGYEEIRTPVLEPLELIKRGVGQHTDIVQKEMYAFEDQGGTQICARPDATAPVMRAYLQHHLEQLKPITKLFYIAPLFRHERPQKGRYRQFHQFGVEVMGKRAASIDVELILLATDIVHMFELPNPRLEINSLGDQASRQVYREIVQTYFGKFVDHLSEHEKMRLQENPLRLLDSKNPNLQDAIANVPSILDYLNDDSKQFFDDVLEGLTVNNVDFAVNTSIVRGLDYYCDTSFEIKVDDLGAQDTVVGGGRYDGLSQQLGGHAVPASGFAMGIERLLLSTANLATGSMTNIVVLPLGTKVEAHALQLAHQLRTQSKQSAIHFLPNNSSLKSGLRAASKYNAQHVLIIGEQEQAKGLILWKNFASGEQVEIPLNDLAKTLKEIV